MKKFIVCKDGSEVEFNKAYKCDCYPFMQKLPAKCVDLILTDPPYGIDAGTMTMGSGQNKKFAKGKEWDSKIPEPEVFKELLRVSKNQVIWGGNYFTEMLPASKHWLIWDKKNPNLSFAEAELAWVNEGKLIRIFSLFSGNKEKIHITQKPIKLFNWCLSLFAEDFKKIEGRRPIVFDPYLGSFTTAVACNLQNIDWFGCEKDKDNFAGGQQRYTEDTMQQGFNF